MTNSAPTVSDLDGVDSVYLTSHKHGGGASAAPAAHTNPGCLHLDGVEPVFDKAPEVLDQDHRVCKRCVGMATKARISDPHALTSRLADPSVGPEDVGLSPMGERPSRDEEVGD